MPPQGSQTEDRTLQTSLSFLEGLLGDYRPRVDVGAAVAGELPEVTSWGGAHKGRRTTRQREIRQRGSYGRDRLPPGG